MRNFNVRCGFQLNLFFLKISQVGVQKWLRFSVGCDKQVKLTEKSNSSWDENQQQQQLEDWNQAKQWHGWKRDKKKNQFKANGSLIAWNDQAGHIYQLN